MKQFVIGVALASLLAISSASADTVDPFGGTVCAAGSCTLTSSPAIPYSGIDVNLTTPISIGALTSLSVSFTDILGGVGGGTPRIGLYDSSNPGTFFMVYLGTPPSFSDSDPATFTAAFNNFNLINGTSDSALGNSGSYVPFATLAASNPGFMIDEAALFLDGGNQVLQFDSLNINGTSFSVTPLAVPGPVVGAGLPGLIMAFGGLLAWRKKRRQLAA